MIKRRYLNCTKHGITKPGVTKPNQLYFLISNTLHAQLYVPHAQALHNPQANAVMQNRYS
jgi:hypothetical protein